MRKILSCLLAVLLVLSLVQTTVFATDEQVVVETVNEVETTESNSDAIIVAPGDDLQSLINAIPVGGSGEFTIQDTHWYLEFGLYIENRDVTLNLVNASMGTYSFENGTADPLILGFGANITLNLDENSRIEAQGHTGNMGVVRVDNSTDWNAETKTFPETFTLTVNGGRFNCVQTDENSEFEPDSVFVAAPGTKVVLTDVYCDGDVKEIDMAGVGIDVPGELVINSGKFTNDVSEYIADGHYCCRYTEQYNESVSHYFVREKEMTDGFSKVLTDGKIILNYDKSITKISDALWLPCEDFLLANEEFYMSPEGFNDDFTKVEVMFNAGSTKEERHTVDVIWNYDEKVSEAAQEFIKKFPDDERPWFNLTDMELVNYWAYKDTEGVKHTSLANYSGELKAILGNTNFLYLTDVRAGDDAIFYTATLGTGKLIHNGTVYFGSDIVGARAQHAIYVPENTGDTPEELIAAAQKRIDDYIGKDIAKITYADSTVTEYYNSEIENYDVELLTVETQLQAARDTLAAEKTKPEDEWDWNVISDCEWTIMQNESRVQELNDYKNYFVECFEEGNDYHFLKSAAGDFFFNIEVLRTGEVFKFVIIKDDTKLTLPSYTSVDLNTKVTVETDESDVPLDTIINVDKLTEGTDYDKIMEVLDDIENEMFDIKLHSGSLNRFFTKLANGEFEVKIPVPEKFIGKNLVVYYVDANNKPVEYEVNVKDGFAIFSTDHFSIYTLAEKHEHSYTEKITKEPTCTEPGEKTFTCDCSDSYTETIQSTGHTPVKGGTESTHTICSVCKVPLSTEHKLTSKITTEPTCTKEGVETFTCECGYTYTKPVEAKGHTEVTVTGKAATCTTTGLTEGKKCSVCGTTTVEQQTIAKKGHTEVTVTGKAATCTATGLTDGKKCSVCGTVTKAQETIKATGHKEVVIPAVAPTFTTVGKTEGKKCSVCGTVTVAQKDVAKLTLATPTVTQKNTAKGIEVNWNKVDGAESYVVYRSVYSGGKWSKWASIKKGVTGTSYVDGTVKLGTSYKYTVRAVNGSVMSGYQNTKDGLKYNVTPTVKVALASNGIKVSWSTAANATGYTVYSSTYNTKTKKWSGWKNRGTVKASKTSWTDKSVKSGTQYKYTIRAVNGKVLSSYNKTGAATLYLAQPTVKIANASTGVKVSWSKVTGATGYTVYRSEYKNGAWTKWASRGTAKANKTSWTDTKVASGVQYKYTVRAINGKVASTYVSSNTVLYLAQPKTTVKAVSNGINVAWTQSAGATGYTVYRMEYNTKTKKWSGWKKMGTAKSSKTNWTDKSAKKGVQYKYTVKAVNGKTASTYKASSSVKR